MSPPRPPRTTSQPSPQPSPPAVRPRRRQSSPLLDLPDELLALVFAELSPVESIDANLCHRVHPFARARILSQINLHTEDDLWDFDHLLREYPRSGNHVRELAILFECSSSARCVRLLKSLPGLINLVLCQLESATLAAVLLDPDARNYLGNLRALHLFADADDRFLQNPRISVWGDYLASWPALEELHLFAAAGMQIVPTPTSRLMPFRTLRRLHLNLTAFDTLDVLDFDRVFPTLEDLVLEETQEPNRFRPILLKISPTSLRKLDLRPAETNPDPLLGGSSVIDDLLPRFSQLETMYFRPSLYNPASLIHVLPQLVHLRHAEFSFGAGVTSEILDVLIELPALVSLVLDHVKYERGRRVQDYGRPVIDSHDVFHMWPGWTRTRCDHSSSDLTRTLTRAIQRGIRCTGTAVEALSAANDCLVEAKAASLLAGCADCLTRLLLARGSLWGPLRGQSRPARCSTAGS